MSNFYTLGISNAPSSFEILMNRVCKEHIRKFILVLFDNILVFNKSLTEHLVHLRMTFKLLMKHKMCVRQAKNIFGVSTVKYFVHVISNKGVAIDPKKISVVGQWSLSKNLRELRGFLGLTSS